MSETTTEIEVDGPDVRECAGCEDPDSSAHAADCPHATPCCDGTGWTGNPRERCAEHYEPLDSIWFGR